MNYDKGIFHLEGNPGISFYQIVSALKTLHDFEWRISKINMPVVDNHMTDELIRIHPII